MHTVLDIGNCSPDHAAIRALVEREFDARIVQAHGLDDALETLNHETVSLVMVNRKLDRDYSDGIEIIRQIKQDAQLKDVPVMLITNYPEHQEAAVSLGALPGFGKLALGTPETRAALAVVLA